MRIAIFAAALTFGALVLLRAGDISAREAQRLASSYSLCVVGMGCGGVGAAILRLYLVGSACLVWICRDKARQHPCRQSVRRYLLQLWRSGLSYAVPEAAYPTRV